MTQNVIERFYQAFQKMDAQGMANCYHEDVVFSDPAFGTLEGSHAANMWRMLIKSQKGKDFRVHYQNVEVDETSGSATWEAWYSFSPTGRKVHNTISARFIVKDGLIIKHVDHFNLHSWSKQALGLQGILLGWTNFFRSRLQIQTGKMLARFEEKMNETDT